MIAKSVTMEELEKRAKNGQGGYEPLYAMNLHEMVLVECSEGDYLATSVMRVKGGWIYRSFDKSNNMLSNVFVPEI